MEYIESFNPIFWFHIEISCDTIKWNGIEK